MQFPEFRPEKITEALASFPPKLSALTEILATPEEMFEQQASVAGVQVPPGPVKMAVQFMQGVESMIPTGVPFGAPFEQTLAQETQTEAKYLLETENLLETEKLAEGSVEEKSSGESAGGFLLVKD